MRAEYQKWRVDYFVALLRTKLRAIRGLEDASPVRHTQLAIQALEFLCFEMGALEEMYLRGVPGMQGNLPRTWIDMTSWERANALFELTDDIRGVFQAPARHHGGLARVEDGEGGGE